MVKKNKLVCFVILHYMVNEETISSIESIMNKVKGEKKIVVVDNGSPNNSGVELEKLYKDNKNVDVIISKENLGFAKGNNIGYRYAVEKYNPKFIVVLNNDVEIYQEDFIENIDKIYEEEKYAILSPDIYSTFSKVHQSPKKTRSYTEEEIRKLAKKYEFRNKSKVIIPLKCWLKEIKSLKKIMQNLKFKSRGIDYSKKYYDVPLHGSCFIFSEIFIKNRKNAFFEGTFMYFESEILDYECHRDGLKTIYDPSIKVNHHHSVSSAKSYKSELKREKFVNKCVNDSLKNFIKLIDSDKSK